MINSITLSKIALSSALFASVVATGPAITNAADKHTQTLTKLESAQRMASTPIVTSIKAVPIATLTNPIEIVKKYAPDTLADWNKTMAQYDKLIGATPITSFSSTTEVTAAGSLGNAAVTKVDTQLSATTTTLAKPVESLAAEFTPMKKVELQSMNVEKIEMDNTDTHMAFFQAQIELAEAVQSKDATVIKQSLEKLHVQYKQQITHLESAAK